MSYQLTATLMDSLGVAMCVFDAEDRAVAWNDCFLKFFPEHADHIHVGEYYADNLRRFYSLRLPAEERGNIERYIRDGIRRHREQTRAYTFVHRGRKLRVAATPQPNGDRVRVWLDLSNNDTGQLVPELRSGEAYHRGTNPIPETLRVFEQLTDGVAVHDATGQIVFVNDRFVEMYRLRGPEDAFGKTVDVLVADCWQRYQDDQERTLAQESNACIQDCLQFSNVPFEIVLPGYRWVRVTVSATKGEQACSIHTDISREKRTVAEMRLLTEQLRHESHRDALTGLLNRRGLMPLLQEASSSMSDHSLLFIALDGFKAVNDLAGHAKGDTVLCQVASILQGAVRSIDSVARLGGDEFVVLLRGCDERQAVAVAQKIVDVVAVNAFLVNDQAFPIGASIGVRTFSGAADSTDILLHDADTACYQAKRQGRGRVMVFGGC